MWKYGSALQERPEDRSLYGRRCFNLNDAGVRVLEATVAADLADALAHDVAAHVNELYPKADMVYT